MSFFTRRIPYDRRRLLARAESLEGGRRWRGAMRAYRQILAAEPRCVEINERVAPLLARSGRTAEAWSAYATAAEAHRAAGNERAAHAVLLEAVRALPRSAAACHALADAFLAGGKRKDALRVLQEGSERVRGRGEAILLLRAAREIEAWHPPTVLALARRLTRDGLPGEALFLLDHLDGRVDADTRRRVRALTFRIEPGLRHAWRWLRAGRGQPRAAALRS